MGFFQDQALNEQTQIQNEVDDLILGFGDTVEIYVAKDSVKNNYGQASVSFHEAIPCTGRSILAPTKEDITIIGDLQNVDVAVVFSRLEMLRKFPHRDENRWIDEDDEFKFENERFRITKVYPTGRVKDWDLLLILLGKNISGKFRE